MHVSYFTYACYMLRHLILSNLLARLLTLQFPAFSCYFMDFYFTWLRIKTE
jgi:hypothetical protein